MMTTPAEFYVSPDGSDTNPGRKEQPFATLERARDAVRKAAPEQPRKVIVRQGAYRLTKSFALGKEDSGTADHPAVWQAAPGELVRLTGGQTIPAAAFLAVTDEKSLARLDPAARGKVLQVDLGPLGPTVDLDAGRVDHTVPTPWLAVQARGKPRLPLAPAQLERQAQTRRIRGRIVRRGR